MSRLAHHARRRNHRRGIWAEYGALLWLSMKGYRLITMRYKTPVGEVDLIMHRGSMLVMVEVKARTNYADAAHAIHYKNQSRVMRAAHYFLVQHPRYANYQLRFDAVLIAWYRWPRHVPGAFVQEH